ncbi:MAG: DUF2442 domain-containing protein [Desulfobacterales bacterium]|nr:DUF2442 domain-containing protein [Desulfobacterales bacterium]
MKYPKIQSVTAIDNYTLVIEFDNKCKIKYDVAPLIEKEMFSPLKNLALFKAVQIEQGGYALTWNSTIDISEYELWTHGQKILTPIQDVNWPDKMAIESKLLVSEEEAFASTTEEG